MDMEEPELKAHACPKCGSKTVRRSLRSGMIENLIFPLIGYRPYRCMSCGERFVDRRGGAGRKEKIEEE